MVNGLDRREVIQSPFTGRNVLDSYKEKASLHFLYRKALRNISADLFGGSYPFFSKKTLSSL